MIEQFLACLSASNAVRLYFSFLVFLLYFIWPIDEFAAWSAVVPVASPENLRHLNFVLDFDFSISANSSTES